MKLTNFHSHLATTNAKWTFVYSGKYPYRGYSNVLFGKMFAKICINVKEIEPRRRAEDSIKMVYARIFQNDYHCLNLMVYNPH